MIKLFQNPIQKALNKNKVIELQGAEPNAELENELEKLLNAFFKGLYKPLAHILKQENIIETQGEVLNSIADLITLIKQNKIIYDGSGFVYTTQYKANTNITKEFQKLGGVFNSSQKKWYINTLRLPIKVIDAINEINTTQMNLSKNFANYQQTIDLTKLTLLQEFKTKFENIYYEIIKNVIKQNTQNLSAQDLKIKLNFDEATLRQIASEYTNNLDLYINNFTTTQIQDLRQIIYSNVNLGLRKENLIQEIQERFDVSKSKAKFLARQETSLLTANIQKQNMLRAGIEYYVWDSSRDRKVRPDHAALNGKIFRFDNPPIVNQKTGARANAGEDFACRCVSRPLLINIDKLKPFYENGYTYYKVVN